MEITVSQNVSQVMTQLVTIAAIMMGTECVWMATPACQTVLIVSDCPWCVRMFRVCVRVCMCVIHRYLYMSVYDF